jgi:hypothetical protein
MRFKPHAYRVSGCVVSAAPVLLTDSARRADTLKRFNSASALPFGQHRAMLIAWDIVWDA